MFKTIRRLSLPAINNINNIEIEEFYKYINKSVMLCDTGSICGICKGNGWVINKSQNKKQNNNILNTLDITICKRCNGTGLY